jgi:acetylglutamate kinase
MNAARLMLLTDVQGVMDKEGEVLTRLTRADIQRLIADGTIAGGMIPKVETALYGIERGVEAAVILDGRTPHGVLLELFTQHGAGTLISA